MPLAPHRGKLNSFSVITLPSFNADIGPPNPQIFGSTSVTRLSFFAGTKRQTGESSVASTEVAAADVVTNSTATSGRFRKSAEFRYTVPSRVGFSGQSFTPSARATPAAVLLPVYAQ